MWIVAVLRSRGTAITYWFSRLSHVSFWDYMFLMKTLQVLICYYRCVAIVNQLAQREDKEKRNHAVINSFKILYLPHGRVGVCNFSKPDPCLTHRTETVHFILYSSGTMYSSSLSLINNYKHYEMRFFCFGLVRITLLNTI